MKLSLLVESNDKLIAWKVSQAEKQARQLEGWDIVVVPAEQNLSLTGENTTTIAARFLEENQARQWLSEIDADRISIRRWRDERLMMPCWIGLARFNHQEDL